VAESEVHSGKPRDHPVGAGHRPEPPFPSAPTSGWPLRPRAPPPATSRDAALLHRVL